jgi:tRNA threonylcarbamoyladenosine biosynthesis protein TsaB
MPREKMLILAIDTSHKQGSVCLARGDAQSFELLGLAEVDGGMFSAQLVPVIAQLLMQHKFAKKDLQGMAAAVGPGSFTGLRIGLSAVKGFAEVLNIPIAAVSTLEAVATSMGESGDVIAVLDAGRKEFYVGEYSRGKRVREALLNEQELAALLSESHSTVVSPDAAVSNLAGDRFRSVPYPSAELIARLGLKKLAAGQTVPVDELDANYVRRDENLFAPAK